MPSASQPQHAQARRALLEDIQENKKGWLQHGIAALAVSLLGLGVAGSMALTGVADQSSPEPTTVPQPSVVQGDSGSTSRSSSRTALDPARVQSLADQRAEELGKADAKVSQSAKDKAATARQKALAKDSTATTDKAKLLVHGQAGSAAGAQGSGPSSPSPAVPPTSGKSCLPVTGGYSIAARFGQVGSWSRYHTGLDFAAPVGTPLHAPSSGVVTNAGLGSASGWAGNYVAIAYADGTHTLMAHMSTVSVRVGQTVSACQLVGAIGMTGRTFGPHVHLEVYPAGITPGDVYKAVNPVGWLNAHGLKP